MNPTEDELDRWIAAGWDRPPLFTRAAMREMFLDEKARHAARDAADWRTKEVADLRRRVARLEGVLGTGGKRLIDELASGFGRALSRSRTREREQLLAEVEKRFEERALLSYAGVWSEGVAYRKGSMVSHAGSAWVAIGGVEPGAKPGRAPEWRLAVKSGESKGTVVA
jgi:hypothetical protein